jgi:hypothetical protein
VCACRSCLGWVFPLAAPCLCSCLVLVLEGWCCWRCLWPLAGFSIFSRFPPPLPPRFPFVRFVAAPLADLAQHFLLKANISAIRRIRKTDNNRIARVCGATIVSRTDELQESDIGTGCGLFEIRKYGDECVFVLRLLPQGAPPPTRIYFARTPDVSCPLLAPACFGWDGPVS